MAPSVTATTGTLDALEASLLNTSGTVPLHDRFRALFTLKAIKDDRVIDIISKGFTDPSALFKHELAYVLGQIKNPTALPVLERVLRDLNEDPMVRHEAAEAIGAISKLESVGILKEFLNDEKREVRETCEIAIAKVEWDNSEEGKATKGVDKSQYTSEDPAPPVSTTSGLIRGTQPTESDIPLLRTQLLDTSLPLFTRYRAMFALRNIGTPTAIDALSAGFQDSSALFKHEIAFVFGQMSHPHSVPSLLKVLEDKNEEEMVRHEAAEALGGIATDEVLPVLREWAIREDAPRAVKESCVVAIDMWEYENSDQFQYANGLDSVKPVETTA